MQSPVQVTFRDISPSRVVSAHVERRAAKLDQFFERIVTCHVVVEAPHRHRKQGQRYHVRIDLHVPGKELVISRLPDDSKEDLYAALDDAFGDAERVLEAYARQLQADTKMHLRSPHGTVAKIFHERGYGFIEADVDDRHEVYFHRNSVLHFPFEKLGLGAKVRFTEEDGDKGPQATTVHVIDPRSTHAPPS